jgi:glycyl-tRNA synthetase beta subunit
VLEIGSEELPAADLTAALTQLRTAVPALLTELRLDYDTVEIRGTPRRLVIVVPQLASRQTDLEMVVKGPPASRAFDETGQPTPAARGFARSRGVDVTALQVVEDKGGRYVAAVVHETGRPATEVLAEALPGCIAGLTFGKSMRWNATNVSYSRPLRWLVALYGPQVVSFTYAGVASGRTSRGLRPYGSPPIVIDNAANYARIRQEHSIVTSVEAHYHCGTTELATRQAVFIAVTQTYSTRWRILWNTPLCSVGARGALSATSRSAVAVMKNTSVTFLSMPLRAVCYHTSSRCVMECGTPGYGDCRQ